MGLDTAWLAVYSSLAHAWACRVRGAPTWPARIAAYLDYYTGWSGRVGPVVEASACGYWRGRVTVDPPGVEVEVVRLPALLLGSHAYRYRGGWRRVIEALASRAPRGARLVVHKLGAFNPPCPLDARGVAGGLKRARPGSLYVAHQNAAPHFLDYDIAPRRHPWARRLLGRLLHHAFKRLLGLYDGFVASARATVEYLESLGVPGWRVHLMPWIGVPVEAVREALEEGGPDPWPQGCRVRLVHVNNITERMAWLKGTDVLGRVKRLLEARGRRGVCVAVAGAVVDEALAARLRGEGVTLLGFMEQKRLYRLLASADLYLFPARRAVYYGGVGNAPMEAMVAGTPVVSPVLEHVPPEHRGQLGFQTGWLGEITVEEYADAVDRAIDEAPSLDPAPVAARLFDLAANLRRLAVFHERLLEPGEAPI